VSELDGWIVFSTFYGLMSLYIMFKIYFWFKKNEGDVE